jgi:hypothetical protein
MVGFPSPRRIEVVTGPELSDVCLTETPSDRPFPTGADADDENDVRQGKQPNDDNKRGPSCIIYLILLSSNQSLAQYQVSVHCIMDDSTTASTLQQQQQQQLQDQSDALNAQVAKQASVVKQLKQDGVADVADAVQRLQALKLQAASLQESLLSSNTTASFPRKSFDDLMIRKMFIVPSFEIHGGVKGLFDLGPPACALKVRKKTEVTDN